MKTKAQKRNEAKKNAEVVKAQKKAQRDSRKGMNEVAGKPGKKGMSSIPQSKKK